MRWWALEREIDQEFAIKILNSWWIHKSDTELKVKIRSQSLFSI